MVLKCVDGGYGRVSPAGGGSVKKEVTEEKEEEQTFF